MVIAPPRYLKAWSEARSLFQPSAHICMHYSLGRARVVFNFLPVSICPPLVSLRSAFLSSSNYTRTSRTRWHIDDSYKPVYYYWWSLARPLTPLLPSTTTRIVIMMATTVVSAISEMTWKWRAHRLCTTTWTIGWKSTAIYDSVIIWVGVAHQAYGRTRDGGYSSGRNCKWHLGLGSMPYPNSDDKPVSPTSREVRFRRLSLATCWHATLKKKTTN